MMDKDEIKSVCEADDQLQWWAMVLFAEMSALIKSNEDGYGGIDNARGIYGLIKTKVNEFPRLVLLRQVQKAKNPSSSLTVEERLKRLEDVVLKINTEA